MGFVSKAVKGVFGGGKQETKTRQQIPAYMRRAGERAVGIAGEIADQPYQPYRGRRVAGLSPQENRARRLAGINSDFPRIMVRQGFDMARQTGGTRWDQDQAQRYMNPFIEQALNPAIRRLNEEAQQNAIAGRAGMVQGGGVGAFGDARTAILEGQMEESRLRGVGDVLSQGYAQAYESGRGAFEDEQARRLRAADLMGTQGGRFSAVKGAEIAGLMEAGAMGRDVRQRQLDTDYQDFQEERDWQQRGLDAYVQALSGPAPTTTTTQAPGPSGAQQAIGLGLGGYGLYKMFFDG